MSICGACKFYYKLYSYEVTVETKFLKRKKKKIEIERENDEVLWNRINKYLTKNNLQIMNIESIYSHEILTGGEREKKYEIGNKKIIGFRVFYITKITKEQNKCKIVDKNC